MSLRNLRGRVAWVFDEDNFDIDRIIGISNLKIGEVEQLAALAMVDFEPGFSATVQPGDLLVGARNFGYGHPHFQAMRAMRHLGIAGVIAESFSPGFFLGELNMGFPLITCPGIVAAVQRGDEVEVDWDSDRVCHLPTGRSLPTERLSAAERGTLEAGGLIPYLKTRIANANGQQPSVNTI